MSTWVKVYNSLPSNPKVLASGDRAAWQYVCGLCYSNEHLTDGFIPRHVLAVVAPGVARAEQLAETLVAATLWHDVGDGWQINDYGDHQRSATQIREQRARDAGRKASVRTKSFRSPRGQMSDSHRIPVGVRDVEESREEENRETTTTPPSSLRSDVVLCFEYWQEKCQHPTAKLTADRRRKIEGRLRDGYTVEQICEAVDGAAKGAFVNDQGKRFDDIELICRNGSKLESFIGRPAATVVPLRPSASDLIRKLRQNETS